MTARKKPIKKMRILFILCGVFLPVVNWLLLYVSPNISSIFMAFQDGKGMWTLENFTRFFSEFQKEGTEINTAFRNTFLTFGIGVVAFPFHVLVTYFIYKKIPFYKFYRMVFFFPTIIFGVAVAMVFSQLIGVEGFIAQWVGKICELDYTPEILADSRFANYAVFAHLLWLTFPGNLIVWSGTFARIPDELLEAGKIDGVNWWTEFTKIVVPLVWPTFALEMVLMVCGIFGASGSVFLLTGGDYGTMTLSAWMYLTVMRGSGGGGYPSNIYNYMSAVGIMLTIVAIALSVIVRKWTDKVFDEVEF